MINHRQQDLIQAINRECHHVEAPLQRFEHNIKPFCMFVIMPLFAFANAGLSLSGLSLSDLTHGIPLGIVLGLFLGKQIGVMGMVWLGVKLKLGSFEICC